MLQVDHRAPQHPAGGRPRAGEMRMFGLRRPRVDAVVPQRDVADSKRRDAETAAALAAHLAEHSISPEGVDHSEERRALRDLLDGP